jgi:hypothetical protein
VYPARRFAISIARAQLVDVSLSRWNHCVARCVRRAFLLGEGDHNRKQSLQNRLEELAEIFAVSVGGFSVMNNHPHLLLWLDPEVARAWSDDEVVRRWGRLFPPRDKSRQPIPVSEHWVQGRLADPKWVANARERLQNRGWFMKCLKEPLSRLANKQDKTRGTSFEGVPVTDAGRCTQGICRANRGNRAARTAIWAPSKLVPFTTKQISRIPSGSQRQGRNR